MVAGIVNGRPSQIMLDTGSTQSLVSADYVEEGDVLDGTVPVHCVHGDTRSYQLAPIVIEIRGVQMSVHATVSRSIPHPAIIGWDAPGLIQQLLPTLKDKQLSQRIGIGVDPTPTTSSPEKGEGV